MEIQSIPFDGLTDQLALEVMALTKATWPPKKPIKKTLEEELEDFRQRIQGRQLFLATDEKLLGYAEIFPRTIHTGSGPLEVMALASVCVTINSRGLGIGRKVVEASFRAVDESPLDVSLFQTGVPGFYEKLGCQLVHNTFVDRTNQDAPDAYPFTDKHTMIYPAGYPWPSGLIDINGKGY